MNVCESPQDYKRAQESTGLATIARVHTMHFCTLSYTYVLFVPAYTSGYGLAVCFRIMVYSGAHRDEPRRLRHRCARGVQFATAPFFVGPGACICQRLSARGLQLRRQPGLVARDAYQLLTEPDLGYGFTEPAGDAALPRFTSSYLRVRFPVVFSLGLQDTQQPAAYELGLRALDCV
jgi:hypothetical protein